MAPVWRSRRPTATSWSTSERASAVTSAMRRTRISSRGPAMARRCSFPAGNDVVAAPADGGPATHLMQLPFEPSDLQSSSDGKWISFEHYDQDDSLYVVRTNGTGLRLVARGG